MAAYDLEEQEQIAEFKAWWAQYGNLIVTVVLVASLGFAGWQAWNWRMNTRVAEAGELYSRLQQAVEEDSMEHSLALSGELIEKYDDMSQTQLGALLMADLQFQKSDFDGARSRLEWAADKGKDTALRELARLRLATALLQKGAVDEALARLQPVPEGPWRARFEDLRGDVLAAQGKTAEARAAWQAASGALGSGEGAENLRILLRIKLESLEG
jgi:predicted negative regulator of RcsB-dependent stress response